MHHSATTLMPVAQRPSRGLNKNPSNMTNMGRAKSTGVITPATMKPNARVATKPPTASTCLAATTPRRTKTHHDTTASTMPLTGPMSRKVCSGTFQTSTPRKTRLATKRVTNAPRMNSGDVIQSSSTGLMVGWLNPVPVELVVLSTPRW